MAPNVLVPAIVSVALEIPPVLVIEPEAIVPDTLKLGVWIKPVVESVLPVTALSTLAPLTVKPLAVRVFSELRPETPMVLKLLAPDTVKLPVVIAAVLVKEPELMDPPTTRPLVITALFKLAEPELPMVKKLADPPTDKVLATATECKEAKAELNKVVSVTPAKVLKPVAACVFVCRVLVMVAALKVACPLVRRVFVCISLLTVNAFNVAAPVVLSVSLMSKPTFVRPCVNAAPLIVSLS